MKRQYTIYNICVLLALLFLGGGWNDAWGQEYNNGWNSETDKTVWDKQTNLPNSVIGTSTETIYVIDGESFQLHLQDGAPLSGGVRDNFNGYIRWYNNATEEGSTANLSAEATTLLRKYKNGFYWAQAMGWGAGPAAPAGLITYINSSIDDNNPETIVCEASSLTDYNYGRDNYWGYYLTEGATVNVRKHFIIKSATNRESFLSERKNNFSSKTWYTNLATSLKEEDIQSIQDRTTGFPEVYAVHTPMEAGTSYRLAERLSNYIVKVNSKEYHANQVRWRVFDSGGKPVTNSHCNIVRHNWDEEGIKYYGFKEIQMTDGSIILGESSYVQGSNTFNYQSEYNKPNIINFYYNLEDVDKTKQQHFYIMAEVRYYYEENQSTKTISDWYPISFITVYLEPNSEPLDENNLPADRKPAALADEDAYKLLASMTFDYAADTNKPQAGTNYPSSENRDLLDTLFGADSETYYGFAMPDKYSNKKNSADKRGNRFVGRGEYAFYKSLNIDGISPGEGQSDEIYYANWSSKSYKVKVTDRLHESKGRPENSDYGYFLYVDAADEAGLIAKLRFTEKLCQRTSLVGTAWICNLKATDEDGQSALNADIGFTLKGLTLNEDGTYTESAPLYKFYTGEVKNNPETGTGFEAYAKWQQVYFKFNINENYDYDAYIVEVANNCRNSHGADYAVDQIEIRCTRPDITVQRENACEASSLIVSSDYETLLGNMGWDVEPDVLADISLSNKNVRKYRYGIMGADPYSDTPNNFVGNVYYGFTDKMGIAGVTGTNVEDWVTINKDLTYDKENEQLYRLSKTMRVAVPTSMTDNRIPDNIEDAKRDEIILNVRAINDFISDTGPKTIEGQENVTVWSSSDLQSWPSDIMTIDVLKANLSKLCEISNTSNNVTGEITKVNVDNILANTNQLGDIYEKSLLALYTFLEIPRIRCPWTEDNGATICLGSIDVNNTDLKFAGEKLKDETEPASGKYEVILFGAKEIALGGSAPLFTDPCLLHSEFIVRPSITITVDGEARADGSTCLNSIHTLTADLWVADVDDVGNIISDDMFKFSEKYPDRDFTFDWFLGNMDLYENYNVSLKDYSDIQALIKACRDDMNTVGPLTSDAVRNSRFYDEHTDDAEILITLLGNGETEPLLVSGQTVMLRWVQHIIAMPYVPDFTEGNNIYSFCMDAQELELDGNPAVPGLSVGFPNVDYINEDINLNIENVPLRLGLRHIKEGTSFNVPIQSEITFGVNSNIGGSLGIFPDNTSVLLRQSDNSYIPVANLTELLAESNVGGELSFTFKEPDGNFNVSLSDLFKEGEIYSLYIPFGEYDLYDAFIQNSCEGYAVLVIKIVPEYLTWQGTTGAEVWYNDGNWHQSTDEELYMGTTGSDANGNDEITNAFAPLYFTKITIPNGEQLTLDKPLVADAGDIILDWAEGKKGLATENIQYDMAVDNTGADGSIEVVPYYINKVEQIYFKPEATLMNQHYLLYDTARVEFTMKQNTPYWMASPLKRVYAGDLYAPTGGTQNTQAFNHIVFNTNDYNRWGPAFYQKAWNKAVAYVESDKKTAFHNSSNAIDVAAVKSNWSIEYNDVWVPYPIGKGFYASVEGVAGGGEVTVRLPKADTEYLYYQTKAANNLSPDPKFEDGRRITDENGVVTGGAGQLATEKPTFTRNENFAFSYFSNGNVTLNLNDVYGESSTDIDQGEHRHFLVGNPYMTYLNMSEFFNENAKKDNPVLVKKYWLLENGASKAIVGTPDVKWENNETEKDPISGFIPPMTAFFVELSDNAGNDKTIEFTTAMMAAKPTTTDNVYTKSYSASNPILTLTAERGETRSVARLLTSDKGHDEYEASEDAVLLLDSELDAPMVYTVAGDVAAQFNTMQSIKNVPLGIYNKKGDEVTLTISGLSRLVEPLYLYDAWTGKSKELTGDSYQLTVEGESLGRYYLRNEALASELESTISIYSLQPGEIVAASSGAALRQVRVYSVNGELVTQRSAVGQTACRLSVPRGAIYMIYAEDTKGNSQSVKLRVR